MILTLWANRARVEQAWQKGLAQGRAQAIAEGKIQGVSQSIAQGIAQDMEQRVAQGVAQGITLGVAEGRIQGAVEENRRWREYLGRREAAERAGLPFSEPPPEPPGDAQSGR